MRLDKEYVKRLANLARLKLTEEEAEKFSRQLTEILSFFKMLDDLNLDAVPPTFHVGGLRSVLRDDKPEKPLERSLVMLNAPSKEKGYFKTNRVVP